MKAYMTVEKGRIAAIRFCGDFFEVESLTELERQLAGRSLQVDSFRDLTPGKFISGLSKVQLSGLLLE